MDEVQYILDSYYVNITSDLSEEDKMLPVGYEEYSVIGIYVAQNDVYDLLASENYQVVLLIHPNYDTFEEDFIGLVIGNELHDITDDLDRLLTSYEFDEDEDEEVITDENDNLGQVEDWSKEAMLAYGKELYDAYGPDIDTQDMTEYEAECYLMYTGGRR